MQQIVNWTYAIVTAIWPILSPCKAVFMFLAWQRMQQKKIRTLFFLSSAYQHHGKTSQHSTEPHMQKINAVITCVTYSAFIWDTDGAAAFLAGVSFSMVAIIKWRLWEKEEKAQKSFVLKYRLIQVSVFNLSLCKYTIAGLIQGNLLLRKFTISVKK